MLTVLFLPCRWSTRSHRQWERLPPLLRGASGGPGGSSAPQRPWPRRRGAWSRKSPANSKIIRTLHLPEAVSFLFVFFKIKWKCSLFFKLKFSVRWSLFLSLFSFYVIKTNPYQTFQLLSVSKIVLAFYCLNRLF